MLETDVLVIGCGPSGLTATVALARQGTNVLAVTKHSQLAPTPRAHVTNQRSFEILRDFGIEAQALACATPYSHMPDQIFLHSLVGEEFGRIRGLGSERVHHHNASPCELADLPQHLLEPILFNASKTLGADVRFDTELEFFTQDEAGVTAHLHDRRSGEPLSVRARYMIGADGGRSVVAATLGLPFEGPGRIGASLNIVFDCDLASYVAHRPGVLYFLVRGAQDSGGPGLGFLRCVKPWTSWMLTIGYAAGQETPSITATEAVDAIRDFLGVGGLECRVAAIDPWPMNLLYATRYHQGRVFCMGDAVHRHVPSNGLGSNTGMQDAYNLAWKLDLVLKGKAHASLLDSYSEERVPVARQVLKRVTKSLESYAPILDTLGSTHTDRAELTADTPGGVMRRAALRASIHQKIYEYQTRGIELNQFYRSRAILDEGQQPPNSDLDAELFHLPTTAPGAHLPHAWVQRDGHSLSTVDLIGKGRFTLLTGIGGDAWFAAANAVTARFGVDIVAFAIGPGRAITDLYFEWAERREIAEDGCLLVRPDGHVAWRCHSLAADAAGTLTEVLASVLGFKQQH